MYVLLEVTALRLELQNATLAQQENSRHCLQAQLNAARAHLGRTRLRPVHPSVRSAVRASTRQSAQPPPAAPTAPLGTTKRGPRELHALPVQRARTELAQAYQIATCAFLARMRKTQPLHRAPFAEMACFRQDLGKQTATNVDADVIKVLLAASSAITVRQDCTAHICKARTASPVKVAHIRLEWRKPSAQHAGAGTIRQGLPNHRATDALWASTSLAWD